MNLNQIQPVFENWFYTRLYAINFGGTKKVQKFLLSESLGYNMLNEYMRGKKDISWGKGKIQLVSVSQIRLPQVSLHGGDLTELVVIVRNLAQEEEKHTKCRSF